MRNIFVYSDSTAFPRSPSVKPYQCWPMKIGENHDFVFLRGFGGATSSDLISIMERDILYFGFRDNAIDSEDIVIFSAGIVDIAPRPITYKLKIVTKLPILGPWIWVAIGRILSPHRQAIQRIARYKLISYRRYRQNIRKISRLITNPNARILITETPIPSLQVCSRSPYFKNNVERLNRLKINEVLRDLRLEFVSLKINKDEYYVSPHDGHHFSVEGHEIVAEQVKVALNAGIGFSRKSTIDEHD